LRLQRPGAAPPHKAAAATTAGGKFSKVSSVISLHSTFSNTLTFENVYLHQLAPSISILPDISGAAIDQDTEKLVFDAFCDRRQAQCGEWLFEKLAICFGRFNRFNRSAYMRSDVDKI